MGNYVLLQNSIKADEMSLSAYEKIVGKAEPTKEDKPGYLVRSGEGGFWIDKKEFDSLFMPEGDYIDRMNRELRQLMEKKEKLNRFIVSEEFQALSIPERRSMMIQQNLMSAYSMVLGERIEMAVNPQFIVVRAANKPDEEETERKINENTCYKEKNE